MDDATRQTCELLIRNRDLIKKVFRVEENATYMVCSSIYTMKGKEVDPASMKECKSLINKRVGIFNNFRGSGYSSIAAMIDASGRPEETLENGLTAYGLLKEVFFPSEFLAAAAMSIAQLAEPSDFERLSRKTREIYDRMKEQHWFRTSSQDTGLCALLALSDKPAEKIIADAEECYAILKPSFFSGEAVQSLAHVLALGDGDPKDYCDKTMGLFTRLKDAGHKYGTYYELASLGVLAMAADDFDAVVPEIIEIDEWLKGQKGFGIMSTVTKKQRLMYAGMVAVKDTANESALESVAVTNMVSMMIMEEVVLYSSICTSAVIVSGSSS